MTRTPLEGAFQTENSVGEEHSTKLNSIDILQTTYSCFLYPDLFSHPRRQLHASR